MPSSLKSKLAALGSERKRPAPATPTTLVVREHAEPACAGVYALSELALSRIGAETPLDVETCAFLDTETTGLSGGAGTVAFLVGVGRVCAGEMRVRQFLMTSYAAEPMLIEAVREALNGCDTLVTFNGKSFDVPLLESRCVMCRADGLSKGMRHIDLLHPARRVWKLRLASCSLSNLEAEILLCPREGDLPGAEVPQRYFDYLKSGDFSPLEAVIDHNRQDVVSMAALLVRLCGAYAAPLTQPEPLDVYSLGRALERRGETEEARACYRLAARPRALTSVAALRYQRFAGDANARLMRIHRREGDSDGAERILMEMIARGQGRDFPYVEMAKLCEHARRDPASALRYAEGALARAGDDAAREAAEHRIERLQRKLGGQKS